MQSCQRIGLRLRSVGIVSIVLVLSGAACSEEFDTTPVAAERGTIGEEIYEVFCQRIASEENPSDVSGRESRDLCNGDAGPEAAETPRLRALAENRARLVAALDATLPEELGDELGQFLWQLLPLYEEPTDDIPRSTRALAGFLAELAGDDEAIAALERLASRQGYRPIRVALGLARPMMGYPDFDAFSQEALATIDEGGPAGDEWQQLLRVAALEMATAEPAEPEPGPTTLELARQLMFASDDAFASGAPRWAIERDARGIVAIASDTGVVPAPFVDWDADGLPDVDVLGRFVGEGGALLDVPTPFRILGETGTTRDPAGRALSDGGSPLYVYFDANRTMLAGIVREAPVLVRADAPALLDMAYGLPALLGPNVARSETYGAATLAFDGPDTSRGPLFDAIHALGTVLDRPQTDDALAVTDALLRDHEGPIASLVQSALDVDAEADAHPGAALVQPNELWDDQIQVFTWIAQEPGLLEALLRSFGDPRSRRLGAIFAEMMRHKDRLALDLPAEGASDYRTRLNRRFSDVVFDEPVDRARPDVRGNQSLFQQSLSIIHDLNGVKMCNKAGARLVVRYFGRSWTVPFLEYGECELLEIDNIAEVYAQSIIGRARLVLKPALLRALGDIGAVIGLSMDDLLEHQSGIDGLTTRPTPYALNRLVFAPQNEFLSNLMGPPMTRDGVPVAERHDPVVFAWEREYCFPEGCTTFYEAMAPLLTAFDDWDRRIEGEGITPGGPRGPRYLFGEMISAQHLHWPSPESDTTQNASETASYFAHKSNGRSYEELVAFAFDDAGLVENLYELNGALESIVVRPGVDGVDVMAAAAMEMLDPSLNAGLADRAGRVATTTNAGTRSVPQTPLYLLLDALKRMDEAFAAEPARHERWLAGRSALVDHMVSTRPDGAARAFDNRRLRAMLLIVVPFLRDRIAAHRAAGDLEAWAADFATDAEATFGSPAAASMIAFLDAVQDDPEARDHLARLLAYMADEASENDAFDTMLAAGADMMQVLEDDENVVPLLHALAKMLAPEVEEVVSRGGELRLDGSAMDEQMNMLREVSEVDDARTLRHVLANLVAMPPEGDAETPLETILDVIAEVNRADPGRGDRLEGEDYRQILGRTRDFLVNEHRGMERLYRIIQDRRL